MSSSDPPSTVLDDLASESDDRVAFIRANPSAILSLITDHHATFTEREIAKALHTDIDDRAVFANLLSIVIATPGLVILRPARALSSARAVDEPAIYSTRAMIELDHAMALAANRLKERLGFGLTVSQIETAIASIETNDPARVFSLPSWATSRAPPWAPIEPCGQSTLCAIWPSSNGGSTVASIWQG